ncbi:uncharacterized protein B0H64DRAFT_477611 [Chaetomium fimeti]|uniref:Uncharacterized protein n=1 Tax=Chaetomium fimeti TaxID=1854472 RepID=A0AAE0H9L5_9PEZI|nr:hypothetical protein B0H64DRAFT_477611 [Chaetomium fimeti]
MQLTTTLILALHAATSAWALPEPAAAANKVTARNNAGAALEGRCVANLPNCQGATYVGDDNCWCDGQVAPCGNWKCGWDGPQSILNCGSEGSGCTWVN